MTTDQKAMNRSILLLDDTHFGLKLKSKKLLVGPLELGLSACYTLSDLKEEDANRPISSIERLKPSLSVKDVYFRGKFELEPQSRRLHYSKKFRLPFINTDLLKLRLTAQLPTPEASKGLLGRFLGLTVTFQPDYVHSRSVIRKAPEYALQLSPRLGPAQTVYDRIGFPGSVYFKANATLHVADASAFSGLRAHLDVHSLNAVIRLYDPETIKPCRVGRNLAREARRLVQEEVEKGCEAEQNVSRSAGAAQLQPDIIDKLSATAREWAHAVLVNSCVATKNLQDKAVQVAAQVRSYVSAATAALPPAGTSTASTSSGSIRKSS